MYLFLYIWLVYCLLMSIIHLQWASFAQLLFLSWARPDLECCMLVYKVIWISYGHDWHGIINLKQINPLPSRTKIVIDYIIDYGPQVISDNRLWKFSDCPSLLNTNRQIATCSLVTGCNPNDLDIWTDLCRLGLQFVVYKSAEQE